MATQPSTLAWKIPWTEEPVRLPFIGSLWVGHNWATSLSLFTFLHWRRKWQPTPVFLPGESQGQRSPVGCRLWGRTESDTTEVTWQQQQHYIHNQHLFSSLLFIKCCYLTLSPEYPDTLSQRVPSAVFHLFHMDSLSIVSPHSCPFLEIFLYMSAPKELYLTFKWELVTYGLTMKHFTFFIETWMIHNVVNFCCTVMWIICICTHTHSFAILFHYGLPQDIDYSSLSETLHTPVNNLIVSMAFGEQGL